MAAIDVTRLFYTFMARVVALEDMAKLSNQMLAVFQQELEMFRREPLNDSSTMAKVLANAPSERQNAYQAAGYRHPYTDHAGLVKLDNALKYLQNHIHRARAVVEEMQKLVDEGNTIMHEDLNTQLSNVALTESSELVTPQYLQWLVTPQFLDWLKVSKERKLCASDYVTMMGAVYGMLQQDFTMQERVVATLIGLDLSSEILGNYQIMWTLRPFVNESVVEEALSWTTPSSS